MKRTRIFTLLLALVLCIGLLTVSASAATTASGTHGDNLTWTLNSSGTLTISGTGKMAGVEVDHSTDSTDASWFGLGVTKVVIEEGITSIGEYAFAYMDTIKTVSLPESLRSIDDDAFKSCTKLTSVNLPDGLLTLGWSAFEGCSSLTGPIVIPAGVTEVGGYAFYGCTSLNAVTLPEALKTIGAYAFESTSLSAVTIPESTESIGSYAFANTNLKTVTIPAAVSKIGAHAFTGCTQLASFQVDPDNAWYTNDDQGILYNKDMSELIRIPSTLKGDYHVPESIEELGVSGPFRNCVGLKNIYIHASVSEIGEGIFQECSSLEGIWVDEDNDLYWNDANGILYTWYTEYNWSSGESTVYRSLVTCPPACKVTNFHIPETVERLLAGCFYNCANVKNVYIPANTAVTTSGIFSGCKKLTGIWVEEGHPNLISDEDGVVYLTERTTEIYDDNLDEWVELTLPTGSQIWYFPTGRTGHYNVPEGVIRILDDSFSGARIQSITFPTTLKTLEYYAMPHCEDLKTVYVTGDYFGFRLGCMDYNDLTLYYPAANSTWAEADLDTTASTSYADSITWKTYTPLEQPDITASNVASSGKIKLTWDKVSGAAQYKVYRATSLYGTWSLMKTTTSTSYTNTTAEAGTQYYYYVAAVDSNGISASKSDVVSRTCDVAQPVVKASNVASSGKIKLTWDAVDGAAKYEVYRSTTGKTGSWTLLKTTTGTSFTNTGAKAGTQYYYKVRALASKSAANSAYSEAVTRTCDLAQPVITLSNVASSGKIKVSWAKVDGAVEYKVYRSTTGKDGSWSLMKTTTGTSYTNTSAKAGTQYYYKVIAIASKSAANSAYSAAKYRTCDLARPVVTIALKSGKPRLTWDAVEGASGYKIYRATSSGGTYSLMKTTTATSYTNTSAVAGNTYYYKVIATHTKSAANSAYSLVKSITAK